MEQVHLIEINLEMKMEFDEREDALKQKQADLEKDWKAFKKAKKSMSEREARYTTTYHNEPSFCDINFRKMQKLLKERRKALEVEWNELRADLEKCEKKQSFRTTLN